MTKPMIVIHNATTGEVIEREMNAEELEQLEIDKTQAVVKAQIQAQIATKRQALLDKLGITEDEAKLLLS